MTDKIMCLNRSISLESHPHEISECALGEYYKSQLSPFSVLRLGRRDCSNRGGQANCHVDDLPPPATMCIEASTSSVALIEVKSRLFLQASQTKADHRDTNLIGARLSRDVFQQPDGHCCGRSAETAFSHSLAPIGFHGFG